MGKRKSERERICVQMSRILQDLDSDGQEARVAGVKSFIHLGRLSVSVLPSCVHGCLCASPS